MKKNIAVLLACIMMFTLVGCGDKETSAPSVENVEGASIGLAVCTLNNPYFVSLVEGAQEKADELGVKLAVSDSGEDAAKQASDVEDLISKGIEVLIVIPCDAEAIVPTIEDAKAKGVKVISVDRIVSGTEMDCNIESDNVQGAELAAEFIVDQLGEGAKVAELQGVLGASSTIDRGTGFHNIADKHLNVVASQTANFTREEGMTVMEDILQGNSNVAAVFAHNDEMALGAIEAISGKKIIVVGFDATDDAIAAVKSGKMAATVAQQPSLMGATAVEKAVDLINNVKVEPNILVDIKLVTAKSVD